MRGERDEREKRRKGKEKEGECVGNDLSCK